MRFVEGDVLDTKTLEAAMAGQDVVYANLAGELEQQARCIVKAMEKTGVKRLIFVSSMGIYDEVPGERFGSILDPYRKSASLIEASGLDEHHPAASLAEQSGPDRLRDHAKRRALQKSLRADIAQERGGSRGQTGDDTEARNSQQSGSSQGIVRQPRPC